MLFRSALLMYSQKLGIGQSVPYYTPFKYQPGQVAVRTTFNNDTTRFFNYRDINYAPGENDHMVVSRSHVIFQTPLAERAIPHYVNLVKEHEGVNILYTPRVLQWDDEPPAEAPDNVDIKKVLDALKSIAEEEPSEDASKRNFIEGNKTIH